MGEITRIEAQEWATGLAATRRARHKGKAVGDDDDDVPTLKAETIAAAPIGLFTVEGVMLVGAPVDLTC